MHKRQADLLYQDILEQVYRSTMDATKQMRSSSAASPHEESVRYFGTIAGLLKVVAQLIAARVSEAPGCEQAILADAIAALRAFVAEARVGDPTDSREMGPSGIH